MEYFGVLMYQNLKNVNLTSQADPKVAIVMVIWVVQQADGATW